jgi:hypothetical protein
MKAIYLRLMAFVASFLARRYLGGDPREIEAEKQRWIELTKEALDGAIRSHGVNETQGFALADANRTIRRQNAELASAIAERNAFRAALEVVTTTKAHGRAVKVASLALRSRSS